MKQSWGRREEEEMTGAAVVRKESCRGNSILVERRWMEGKGMVFSENRNVYF